MLTALCAGHGLDASTPIATSTGWMPLEDLTAGDEVFDEAGDLCRVTASFALPEEQPCLEVRFSDGTRAVAGLKHQWPSATRELRAAQSARRLAAASPGARARLARVRNLEHLAASLAAADEADCLHTSLSAAALTDGLLTRAELYRLRGAVAGTRLPRNARFDLRPVITASLRRARSQSVLARTVPDYELFTTDQLAASLHARDGASNHAVAIAEPLDMPFADLPVDPYVLGAWLGDGSRGTAAFTGIDDDLFMEIETSGYVMTHSATNAQRHYIRGLLPGLREIGVLERKHIPSAYLRASYEERITLLRGLMDTDGTVGPSGSCELSLCDPRLAQDAIELIRSLGIKTTVRVGLATITETAPVSETPLGTAATGLTPVRSSRVTGIRHRIHFTTDQPVFAMARKSDALPDRALRPTAALRYVTSVTPVTARRLAGLVVDSPSGLFLAGRGLVPTCGER